MMERLARLRREDLNIMERFLRLDDWRKRITVVFVLTALPEDSLEREKGFLAVEGAKGSIMNTEVLQKTLNTTLEIAAQLKNDFRIHIIDTSSVEFRQKPRETAEAVADLVLDTIEELLREEILSLPQHILSSLFRDTICLKNAEAKTVIDCFASQGQFRPRDEVEKDTNSVQAIPIVIVRNRTGHVLLLRRKEATETNPLHEKLVIWAGGHVRIEDGSNGRAVLRCAVRELQEELRLSVEEDKLRLLGTIYIPKEERSSKHVALVYEWRADRDDVAVALSEAEFFERRGNSLSGRFIDINTLVEDVLELKIDEIWSQEIVREFLAPNPALFPPRLF